MRRQEDPAGEVAKIGRVRGVVPHVPHQPSPTPYSTPWQQLAIEDQNTWQPAPDTWRKDGKKGKKGAKGKDGKGKGKYGKGKGKEGKGKGGKADKAAAKAKAKAAALWQAWRSESGK